MNFPELLTRLIENIVASIPQIVAVLTVVGTSLTKVRTQVNDFPTKLSEFRKEVSVSLNATKTEVSGMLSDSRRAINSIVADASKQLQEEVTLVMAGMQNELKFYREQQQAIKGQLNIEIKQNRAMFDIILNLVAQNPEYVKKGISATITKALTMTQEELKNQAVVMIDSLPLFETVVNEALLTYTNEEVDDVLGKLGYERKETANREVL